jgi:hypothetical protein
VQVLQLAASNVPDGVLAARTGSKAITAAIDTLQVRLQPYTPASSLHASSTQSAAQPVVYTAAASLLHSKYNFASALCDPCVRAC